MSETDVLSYLQTKALHLKPAGGFEMHTHCPFCAEDPGERGRLYINTDPMADIPGLYMCLAGETEVITWDGVRPIAELAGSTQRILTTGGRWVDAPFRSFGVQKLMKVTLTRNGREMVVHATPGHRWMVRAGADRSKLREVVTSALKPGARMGYSFGQGVKNVSASPWGVAQGIVFGDGTLTNGGKGSSVAVYDKELLEWFPLSPVHEYANEFGTQYWNVGGLPSHFKRMPSMDDSRSFLLGWLAGYFAADGDITDDGHATLWSANADNLRFARDLCLRIGVGTYEVRGPYFGKGRHNDEPMYALSFLASTLTPDFFVLEKHRSRYRIPSYERKGWVVQSVEETDREEEVYCATVEGTHTFALAGNLLTGNCHRCGEKGNLITLKRFYGDNIKPEEIDVEHHGEILRIAAAYYHELLGEHEDVFAYLKGPERGLTTDTIIEHQLGYAPAMLEYDMVTKEMKRRTSSLLYQMLREQGYTAKAILATKLCVETRDGKIVDSLQDMITIPYHAAGNVAQIRGRAWPYDKNDKKPKYKTCGGDNARLFNSDLTWDLDEITICEGEFDALVMTQLGFPSVGVPGAQSWQEGWNGYLSNMKRVWLLYDRDEAGQKGAKKVADRFGSKVRWIHLSPEGVKVDPTKWVHELGHTAEDYQHLLDKAAGGLLKTVDQAIGQFDEVQGLPGLKFNHEILDILIEPGFQTSQVLLLLAKTGCLTGDTEIAVNRAGRGFKIRLDDLFDRWEGTRYAWDRSTPTMIQRGDGGVIRLGQVDEVWDSGVKPVWRVSTPARSIKATAEHPFLTPEGWKKLGELEVGGEVFVNAGKSTKGRTSKSHYFYRSGLVAHPYCNRRNVRAGGHSVPLHRLVFEAAENQLTLDDFLLRCRTGDVGGLVFFDPEEWAIHHIDHDHFNNDLANLKKVTHAEHKAIHAAEGTDRNVLDQMGVEEILAIEFVGEEHTYDISVVGEPHNFVANGFVVHNTGKTIWCLNQMQRMRMVPGQENLKFLFISLEQTAGEWWDRARRLHRFYNIDSTDADARDFWVDNMMIVDKNRLSIQDLESIIEDFVYRFGQVPDVVWIDYLGYLAQSWKGERYERVSDAVMGVKGWAKDLELRVVVPHQVNRSGRDGEEFAADASRDSGVVEETADFLLTLWTPDNALMKSEDEKTGEILSRIAKSRHGGRGVKLAYQWAPLSLAMVPKGDPFTAMAAREFEWRRRYKDNWERAVYRHKTGFEGTFKTRDVPEIVEQPSWDDDDDQRL